MISAEYRKRPVVIQAALASDLIAAFAKDWEALPDWASAAYDAGVIVAITSDSFTIKTLEGDHLAQKDDMIIQGVQGELYPCKPDIFDATYEPVADPPGEDN